MSADFYISCPICDKNDDDQSVRVDYSQDITLFPDGTMTSDIKAKCSICDREFKLVVV